MKFRPFQKYTLYTRLSIFELKQRLQQSLVFRSKWLRQAYDGEIEGDEFTIFQVFPLGYPKWPEVVGRFSTSDRNTSIDVSVKFPKLALILGGAALGFLAVCFIGMIWSSWSENSHSLRSIGGLLLIPAGALFLIYSFITFNTLVVTVRSKKFLRRLFEAE
jgi:hypothetical protein